MEGGSPALIWESWTLPMYYAQQRYWADNPPVDRLVRAYFGIKPKKTPKPSTVVESSRDIDLAALDAPLTAAELGHGKPIGANDLARGRERG